MPKGNHGHLLKKGKYLSRYKLGEEPRSPLFPTLPLTLLSTIWRQRYALECSSNILLHVCMNEWSVGL
jgi:hypothetical protein